jgi:hypothetical protein
MLDDHSDGGVSRKALQALYIRVLLRIEYKIQGACLAWSFGQFESVDIVYLSPNYHRK